MWCYSFLEVNFWRAHISSITRYVQKVGFIQYFFNSLIVCLLLFYVFSLHFFV